MVVGSVVQVEITRASVGQIDRRNPRLNERADVGAAVRPLSAANDAEGHHRGGEPVRKRLGAARQLEVDPPHAIGAEVGFERDGVLLRSEEHTSELQSLMRISYAVFCLKKKIQYNQPHSEQIE